MKPISAWLRLGLAAAITAGALLLPFPGVALLWAGAMALVTRRTSMWIFAATSVIINGTLLAWLTHGAPLWPGTPFSLDGLQLGIIGAMRLNALVAANLAWLERVPMAAFLDGLRLGARPTGFLAAVLIATQDLGRDVRQVREARVLDGAWPADRWGQVREGGRLLPTLFLTSWRRAQHRRDALRGAGVDVGVHFAPIVAVAALAIAGRLAFVVLPNIALTYVVVFLGGTLFGARVGFWAAFWAMVLTDLMLTGLAPTAFLNAPAMGLLGLLGGWTRGLLQGRDGRIWAAVFGVLGTLLFSLVMDLATWAVVPEFRTSTDLLWIRVAAGLAFNVVPAITNGVLFAVAAGPVARAAAAWRQAGRP